MIWMLARFIGTVTVIAVVSFPFLAVFPLALALERPPRRPDPGPAGSPPAAPGPGSRPAAGGSPR